MALSGSCAPSRSKTALVPEAWCPCAGLDLHSWTKHVPVPKPVTEARIGVLWLARGRWRGRQSAALGARGWDGRVRVAGVVVSLGFPGGRKLSELL